ncbi:MAG: biotin/lipoyl-binding protein [Chloroflexi bacterium]|nr:biotin/lipoyl-binding protein [Chloroflexota bacterium]
MKYATTINDHTYVIEINREGEVTIDGETCPIDLRAIDDVTYSLLIKHRSHEALVELAGDDVNVLLNGRLYGAQVQDERARRLTQTVGGSAAHSGEVAIKSPMPGLIVAVPVSDGQTVKKGQTVVVLESMKMENELKAPRDGTVASIKVVPRQNVEQHQVLVILA